MPISQLFAQAEKLAWEYFNRPLFAKHPKAIIEAKLSDLGFYGVQFNTHSIDASYFGVTYNLTGETYAQRRV